MIPAEGRSQKHEPPSTIDSGSTTMSNRQLEAGREPMNQKEESAMKKLQQNALKPGDKLKEL